MDAPAPAPVPPAPPAPPIVPAAASPYGAAPASAGRSESPSPYGAAPAPVPAPGTDLASPYAVAPAAWGGPAPRQNVLAWVAFGLGLGGIMFGLLASIPAIVCGHLARRQIRERGEEGGAAALVGLVAGYVLTGIILLGIGLYVLLILSLVAGAGASASLGSSI